MQSSPIECRYPHPGWVEQDANAIWHAQIEAARRTLDASGMKPPEIAAIGITNQRETTVVWNRKTGQPVAPAIVWQCRRTAAYCDALQPREVIERKTGLIIDAYFSASKIRWILDHAGVTATDLLFGNVDTWLIWKLTNGAVHATDPSNASRTMLMDLAKGDWDDELLGIFGVPREMMPKSCRRAESVARRRASPGRGDSNRGHRGRSASRVVRASVLQPRIVEKHIWHGMFRAAARGWNGSGVEASFAGHACRVADATAQYAVEGSVFIAGAAVQWLRDKLGVIATAAESELLAESVPDTGGCYVVRRSWGWARRIGIRRRGESSAESRRRRIGRGWCARRLRASPIRPANWWPRWKPTAGRN